MYARMIKRWLISTEKKAGKEVMNLIEETIYSLRMPQKGRGDEYIDYTPSIDYLKNWYLDSRLKGICNSYTRPHIRKDLFRYLYAACFAKIYKRSPRIKEFPTDLIPEHSNAGSDDPDAGAPAGRSVVELACHAGLTYPSRRVRTSRRA